MNETHNPVTRLSEGNETLRSAGFIPKMVRQCFSSITARSENFVGGPYWIVEVVFLAVLVSTLFSGGIDNRLFAVSEYWYPGYFQKIEHPLLDLTKVHEPASHEAKINFRLTVPVFLHILHVSSDQRWLLPVLAAAGTVALIGMSCLLTFQFTRDRVSSMYVALAVCTSYIGSFAFTMYYDSLAISQLLLAMLNRVAWPVRGLLVFTASFTDERAWIASPLLVVQTLCTLQAGLTVRQRLCNPKSLVVFAGMLAYCIGRLALEKFAGLTSPHDDIGIELLFHNFPFWHAGIWLALKGGWLLIFIASLLLWHDRQKLAVTGFLVGIFACISAGFLVEDVVRSTAYVFPALIVALLVISQHEEIYWLRVYCFLTFLISLLSGNYNIWRDKLSWFEPLAAKTLYQVLRFILQIPRVG